MTPPPPNPDPTEAEFGPAGYLPPRAAQRARKIVLREQMGLQWPIASAIAGVLIVLITLPLVLSDAGPPGLPYVEVGALAQVDPRGDAVLQVDGREVLVVRGGGVLRAFLEPPPDARYCPTSRRIESSAGDVWSLQGRVLAGDAAALTPAGAIAYDDRLYLDVVTPLPTVDGGAAGEVLAACG